MPADVTIVVPSYNRCDALRTNLPVMLELDDLLEIVVVLDHGVDDGTEEMVAREYPGDPRVRVLRQSGRGLPPARNHGIENARGDWIIISDDDLRLPNDYATVLKAEAAEHGADIVGAPWIHIKPGSDYRHALAAAQERGRNRLPGLEDHSVVPQETIETPFMPAPALINRRVFDRVGFYPGYVDTGWRDETDFFIQAIRAGFTVVLSPKTAMYQEQQWEEGGSRRARLQYEWTAARNNWTFLRRQGSWLREQGHISSAPAAQLAFMWHRVKWVVGGFTRARIARLRGA